MNTEELVAFLDNTNKSAEDLLKDLNPNHKRRFLRLMSSLQDLILDVQETYPEANYYVQEDSVLLMLGDSHSNRTGLKQTTNRQLVAISDRNRLAGLIDGGAW